MHAPRPPRLARWLLLRLLPARLREPVIGDFEESFSDDVRARGPSAARRRHATQLLRTLVACAPGHGLDQLSLVRAKLSGARRSLGTHRFYFVTAVLELGAGFALCLVAVVFVGDELSYDRHHDGADRAFRIVAGRSTKLGALWGPALESTIPEIARAGRIVPLHHERALVVAPRTRGYESRFYYADAQTVKVFGWRFVAGDAEAFAEAFRVVLTESASRRYFGDAGAVGERLTVDGDEFLVAGVVADVPRRSHFQFELLASMETLPALAREGRCGVALNETDPVAATYVLLHEGADARDVERRVTALLDGREEPAVEGPRSPRISLQPMKDVYLATGHSSGVGRTVDRVQLIAVPLVAFVILTMACLNVMYVGRARAACLYGAAPRSRATEPLRARWEAVVVVASAVAIGALLAPAVARGAHHVVGHQLSLIGAGRPALLGVFALAVILAWLALARPPRRGSPAKRAHPGPTARRLGVTEWGTLVPQLAAGVVLLACAVIVSRQLGFVQSKELGAAGDRIVVIPLHGSAYLRDRIDAFEEQLRRHPPIVSVAASHSVPGQMINAFEFTRARGTGAFLRDLIVDPEFIDLYGLELVAGRGLSQRGSGARTEFLPNESAVRALGFDTPDLALGSEITWHVRGGAVTGTIVGVTRDFHLRSLHEPILPLVMHDDEWPRNYVSLRVRSGGTEAALAYAQLVWRELETEYPFDPYVLDHDLASSYDREVRTGRGLVAAAIGSLFITGLAVFAALRYRAPSVATRDGRFFGVRSRWPVCGELCLAVGVATIVACPVTYIAMRDWLGDFAYHVRPGIDPLAMAGGVAGLAALLPVLLEPARRRHARVSAPPWPSCSARCSKPAGQPRRYS